MRLRLLDNAAALFHIWHMENAAAQRQSSKSVKTRGRPARISREMILDAAAELSASAPDELPSLNGIARALKISPMAIYTYFASKDELLQALSDRLLTGFSLEIPPSAAPHEILVLWANAMRAHVLVHPQLINLLSWEGGHTSLAWLRRSMMVSDALGQLGFSGVERARATLWVWHVVMSAINIELRNRIMPQALSPEELASLDPAMREQVEVSLGMSAAPDHADSFFAYQLDRMCEALRVMNKE